MMFDSKKLKVIHDYKKLKRKEGLELKPSINRPKKETLSKMKPKKATNTLIKLHEENMKKMIEENLLKRDQKRRNKAKLHKKLNAKTSRGQPVMSNKIDFLLDKILQNKSKYCTVD